MQIVNERKNERTNIVFVEKSVENCTNFMLDTFRLKMCKCVHVHAHHRHHHHSAN